MRFMILALPALVLLGCGEAGPTPEELSAAMAEKDCGKLYAGMSKVITDQVRTAGIKADLGDKPGFVKICVGAGLTDDQLKCLDPNLGGTEACKTALESVADKTKELQEHLLAPMKKGAGKPAAEGAEAPAAPE
jgi:hypothetical protein